MEDNDTVCVGIDLGTSRSSVSASNGERHVVDSYVGWPVDIRSAARWAANTCAKSIPSGTKNTFQSWSWNSSHGSHCT